MGHLLAGRPDLPNLPSRAVRNTTIKLLESKLYHHKHWTFRWDHEMLLATYPAADGELRLVLQARPQVLWLALVPGGSAGHIQVVREPFYYRSLKQACEAIGELLAPWKNPKVYDLFGDDDEAEVTGENAPEAPGMSKAVALCDWKPTDMMTPLLDRTYVMGRDAEGIGKVLYLKEHGFLPRREDGPPVTEWAYLPEEYTWQGDEAVPIESISMDMGDYL